MSPARLLALVALLAAGGARATVLHVDGVSGRAVVQRAGQSVVMAPGYEVIDQDQVNVGADARLDLVLGRHGLLELGPGAQLLAERIPFATYADDLRTRVRLVGGFLRVVWKRPSISSRWPLTVDIGDFTLALTSGEFLFQAGAAPVVCIGDGEVAIDYHGAGAASSKSIAGPACARLTADASAAIAVRLEDLVVPRQRRVLALLLPAALPPVNAASETLPGVAGVAIRPPAAATPRSTIAPLPPVEPPRKTIPPPPPVARIVAPAPDAVRAAPDTVAENRGQWMITLASFADRAVAEARAAKLRDARYTAEVVMATVKGRTWYRVQLRGFPSADLARQVVVELAEREGYKDAWISRQ